VREDSLLRNERGGGQGSKKKKKKKKKTSPFPKSIGKLWGKVHQRTGTSDRPNGHSSLLIRCLKIRRELSLNEEASLSEYQFLVLLRSPFILSSSSREVLTRVISKISKI